MIVNNRTFNNFVSRVKSVSLVTVLFVCKMSRAISIFML